MSREQRNRQILRRRRHAAVRARSRRGVLLLVVLSILVMFMLVGTAFVLTGSQYGAAERAGEKASIAVPQQADLLDRALRQVLRDTHNRSSAARYHSLLRDAYGTDGFVAKALWNVTSGGDVLPLLAPQHAGVAANGADLSAGQLVDLFVYDVQLRTNLGFAPTLDEDLVLELETDQNGLPVEKRLERTDGYYNGCLLTMLSGPAKGQSGRIVSYDYLNDNDAELAANGNQLGDQIGDLEQHALGTIEQHVVRLRVMTFPRADGLPLQLGLDPNTQQNDLAGHSFMVNGRPFNGSGVGLNLLSQNSQARLTAYEGIRNSGRQAYDGSTNEFFGGPVALLPDARFFFPTFKTLTSSDYNVFVTAESGVGALHLDYLRQNGLELYQNFVGPGGADESYDAPDFQNMFLASNPLRPRPRGRVIDPDSFETLEVAAYYPNLPNAAPNAPARLDLDGLPIPSFHRPALVNFWLHRLYNAPWLASAISDQAERVRAILKPYDDDGAPVVDAAVAAQIVAFKRKFILRPLVEDHPNFTGSNPLAVLSDADWQALGAVDRLISGGEITFPSFEVAGPWDVDNDGDGVPDSVWIDLGMPVQRTEDGRMYKPLFAILVRDLDGRLNLNAHGSMEQLAEHSAQQDLLAGRFDQARYPDRNTDPTDNRLVKHVPFTSGPGAVTIGGNLAGGVSSDLLPSGSGWGPADASLRSVLSPDLPGRLINGVGSPLVDDYARLLRGRPPVVAGDHALPMRVDSLWGRYGAEQIDATVRVEPGVPFNWNNAYPNVTLDLLATLEKPDYPVFAPAVAQLRLFPTVSGFSSLPDLRSAYAVGLDYMGQPTVEAQYLRVNAGLATSLVVDSPYELDLMDQTRRDSAADLLDVTAGYTAATPAPINDDAPFSPGELERVLRSFDADATQLPARLWDIVDAFDAEKLAIQQQQYVNGPASPTTGVGSTAVQLLQAQIESDDRRRSVTTESFDIPSTNEDWTARLVLGADGLPGVPDDPSDSAVVVPTANLADDWNNGVDDYTVVMGEAPPAHARILDYLRYRIVLELKRQDPATYPIAMLASDPALVQAVNLILDGGEVPAALVRNARASFGGLLAPEVVAGLKMDLNRPFGDGRDNTDHTGGTNNVVDEPFEAGEPWLSDGNGAFVAHLEQNGVSGFQGSLDRQLDRALNAAYPFEYTLGMDANGRGAYVDNNSNGQFDPAGDYLIHDDADMARQLYARHLYCLAMLVMDENYLAPYDANDPQEVDYLDPDAKPDGRFGKAGSPAWQIAQGLAGDADLDGAPAASAAQKLQAVRIARKKLTCRKIAQWAINCADMRDPDAVCTPFEYDENPWDGWNTIDQTNGLIYPLDGDVGTDENFGVYNVVGAGAWNRVNTNTAGNPPLNPAQQTRGVVWGAERPELLISETLALHDRRTEDLSFQDVSVDPQAEDVNGQQRSDQNYKIGEALPPDDTSAREDITMDQRLRPEGSAFIELFNPWSQDGHVPAELAKTVAYQDLDGDGFPNPRTGIDLAKLSPVGIPGTRADGSQIYVDRTTGQVLPRSDTDGDPLVQYSPVWRIIAIEDHPRLRNDDEADDPEGAYADKLPKQYEEYDEFTNRRMQELAKRRINRQAGFNPGADPNQTRATIPDPDFPTFNQDLQPRVTRNTESINRALSNGETLMPEQIDRVQFYVPRHYVERTFYLTSNNDAQRDPEALKVRIPLNRIKVPETMLPSMWQRFLRGGGNNSTIVGQPRQKSATETLLWPDGMAIFREQGPGGAPINYLEIFNHHFVPSFSELFNADIPDGQDAGFDLQLAPVLPGRYAVVGSAGYSYVEGRRTGVKRNPGRFITPIGRRSSAIGPGQEQNLPITGDEADPVTGQTAAGNKGTRRIELIPSPNPDAHQVLVAENAGTESSLISPAAGGTHNRNVTSAFVSGSAPISVRQDIQDALDDGRVRFGLTQSEGRFAERFIQPAVAVPVKGMSLSAPLDNYLLRWMELEPGSDSSQPQRDWEPKGAGGEGHYVQRDDRDTEAPFDEPFDLPLELVTNHTTPNYRSVHLQRLANPMLPWNPPPGEERHVADVPVNPYVTIDSASVDLTAYSGTDPAEQSLGNGGDRGVARVNSVTNPAQMHEFDAPMPPPRQASPVTMASQQRGFHAVNLAQDQAEPARLLFQRELPSTLDELASNRIHANNSIHDAGGLTSQYTQKLDMTIDLRPRTHVVDFPLQHSLGFANVPFTRAQIEGLVNSGDDVPPPNFYTQSDGQSYHRIDVNGDGLFGEIVGAPKTGYDSGTDLEDDTYPWMFWGNRPYASAAELLQVPGVGASQITADFTVFNSGQVTPFNPYNGARPEDSSKANAIDAISLRRSNESDQFGHLLNLFSSDLAPAEVGEQNNRLFAKGSANLHRLLSYVRVPSPFVATQTTVNPAVFNVGLSGGVEADPRNDLLAPFNRVDRYREPGRVNLNTVTGLQDERYGLAPANPSIDARCRTWSPTYDGLMHRWRDRNLYANSGTPADVSDDGVTPLQLGHRGPAWRDVVVSRRGYQSPAVAATVGPVFDSSEMALNSLMPTFFANPFREPEEGVLAPLNIMIRPGAEASLLRSHPFSPGEDGRWGDGLADSNADGVRNDADEAGLANDASLFEPDGSPSPYFMSGRAEPVETLRVPLFSAGDTETALNGERNAALRYMPMTRLSSMTTTRSGVFAIWITVGFFEVEPADAWTDAAVQARFNGDRELYDRVYPDGYQLGKELGSDTGDTHRYRGFWMVDRTVPVAFRPGEDINLERMILLQREIE